MKKGTFKCSNCGDIDDEEESYFSEITKKKICRGCFQNETEWCPLCEEDFYSQDLGKYHCYFGNVEHEETANIKVGIYKAVKFPIYISNGFNICFQEENLELVRVGKIHDIEKNAQICPECIEKYILKT